MQELKFAVISFPQYKGTLLIFPTIESREFAVWKECHGCLETGKERGTGSNN